MVPGARPGGTWRSRFAQIPYALGYRSAWFYSRPGGAVVRAAADKGLEHRERHAEVADITLTGGNMSAIVSLRRMSTGLMDRLNSSFQQVMLINSGLLATGMAGIITPQMSSLLHNATTVTLSMRNSQRYDV